jgi:hypothetical protein
MLLGPCTILPELNERRGLEHLLGSSLVLVMDEGESILIEYF